MAPDIDDFPDPEAELHRMTLPEHLDELRSRLMRAAIAVFVAMTAAFIFWKPLWVFAEWPFEEAARLQGVPDATLMSLDPGEGFLSILKLCFLTGFVAASPIVLWQLWGFIAAGLYPKERRVVRVFFPVSLGLFAMGTILAYQVLIPFGMRFLIKWNLDMGVQTDFRVQTYISTCLTMVFGMALLFLLPLVMLFLQATDLVARKTFQKGWRYAVIASLVAGMMLTDPSPVTQLLMAIPVTGLYFLGVYAGKFVGEKKIAFRWYHAWPLLLAALLLLGLLTYTDELNELTGGAKRAPAPIEAPAEPPAD